MQTIHLNKPLVLLAILSVVLIWGANFTILKVALNDFNPYELLFARLFLVSITLSPFISKIQKQEIKYILLCSLLLIGGHFMLLYLALEISTNVSAIALMLQLSVPFSLILASMFFKDHLTYTQSIGLIIAFVGIILLFYSPSMFNNITALMLGLLSAFCLGLYFIFSKKIKHLSPLEIIAYMSITALPLAYIAMILNDGSISHIMSIKPLSSWVSLLYATFLGTMLAHTIWAWLVRHQELSFISPFLLLIPLTTVGFSWVIVGEIITLDFIITATIVVAGLFLVFISRRRSHNPKQYNK